MARLLRLDNNVHKEAAAIKISEPRREISINVVCETGKGSDQPGHMGSLTRAFASL